ncbi:hypothetical protein BpHYR1_029044 [Brachionus plicatilis]|uniref:Uncharacterized protein n=1 Tax=Brachionus plicatilis TaxID=10195 RepID=A0A3M7RDF0_BRAPC|nr:hypothetical protein BpHYR1_029044 [Brachionus plicatilis]
MIEISFIHQKNLLLNFFHELSLFKNKNPICCKIKKLPGQKIHNKQESNVCDNDLLFGAL